MGLALFIDVPLRGFADLTKERLELGHHGEKLALKEAKRLGYKCIEQNYRCKLGEIDLIARDGACLVFIEIKTRKGSSIGYAKEAVNLRKRIQISRVALYYMKDKGCCDKKARFDVIAININNGEKEIEVIKNAFDLAC
jgi:putative endonuclease